MAAERLQKLLAGAGVASRREAERLITAGRVTVRGVVVRELGARADAAVDEVAVDGKPIETPAMHTYLALHKPPGYITTASDDRGRRTVMDLLPPGTTRVFPIGRLDRDSEGLLLLTDDGEFALHVSHPRFSGRPRERAPAGRGEGAFDKEYLALAEVVLAEDSLKRLRERVPIEGRRTAPAVVERVRGIPAEIPSGDGGRRTGGPATAGAGAWYRVVLGEGRNRQIRRMFAAEGVRVLRLLRVRVGPVRLGRLAPGAVRPLSRRELRRMGVMRSEE